MLIEDKMKYHYYCSCVNWPKDDISALGGLKDMIDAAHTISRKTFYQRIDYDELADFERRLGYARHWKRGLTMSHDYHVTYHKSRLHGKPVYFIKHSAIEYVFTGE